MTPRIILAAAGLAALAAGSPALAQQGPLTDPIPAPIPVSTIAVDLKPVVTGLGAPIWLTTNGQGNGRKYILDQTGVVWLFRDEEVKPTPFLDITSVVSQLTPAFTGAPQGLNPSYDERGLLGLAFHPDFGDRKSPGFRTLYTLHNVPVGRKADFVQPQFPAGAVPNCQEVIAEWQVDVDDQDVVNPASYREVLRFDRPEFNHNGGTLAFGPDGFLYAAFGDGGNANDVGNGHIPVTGNAQVLTTILGKMIRIDPLHPALTVNKDGAVSDNGQYRIPRDNPFFTRAGAVREIYAYGFRNPFRFSFNNAQLVLADVGQNNIEEVDVVTKGGNYGWNKQEGTFLFMPTGPNAGTVFTNPNPDPSLIEPVFEYDHFEASAGKIVRIAIVGGFVYNGSKIPALAGKYVFADLNGFLFDGNLKTGKIEQLLDTEGFFIKGIGEDANGELYLIGGTTEGPGTAGSANGSVMQLVAPKGKKGK